MMAFGAAAYVLCWHPPFTIRGNEPFSLGKGHIGQWERVLSFASKSLARQP